MMATQRSTGKKSSPILMYVGIAAVIAVVYVYTTGDDTTTASKPATTTKSTSSSTTDAYLPVDYKASFPELKIVAKDAFMPLIRKTAVDADGKQSLPSTITGGGSWSYDGTVTVDNHLQGLLDEEKSGESDYVSVGEHWKHGKIKRITDSEIDIVGDDGTTATMKMGEPSQTAAKEAAPAVAPLQPDMTGAIGATDLTPLPSVGMWNGGNNNGQGNGNGWGGRGNRGGGRRGRGGGMMMFGGGG